MRSFHVWFHDTSIKGKLQTFKVGITFGYWPCISGYYIQIILGYKYLDIWHGLPSYLRKDES